MKTYIVFKSYLGIDYDIEDQIFIVTNKKLKCKKCFINLLIEFPESYVEIWENEKYLLTAYSENIKEII